MFKLRGKKVWVVEYEDSDLFDCNGVFTSKEKVLKSVNEDFKRCSDIWIDKELEYETKDYMCYTFTLLSGCMKIRTSVVIYLTFIQ